MSSVIVTGPSPIIMNGAPLIPASASIPWTASLILLGNGWPREQLRYTKRSLIKDPYPLLFLMEIPTNVRVGGTGRRVEG